MIENVFDLGKGLSKLTSLSSLDLEMGYIKSKYYLQLKLNS
jgi:hypothetical protein